MRLRSLCILATLSLACGRVPTQPPSGVRPSADVGVAGDGQATATATSGYLGSGNRTGRDSAAADTTTIGG